MQTDLFLGLDLGTSGCRAVVIEQDRQPSALVKVAMPAPQRTGNGQSSQDPEIWWQAIGHVIACLAKRVDLKRIRALAVDGTSATLLRCDAQGRPLGPALMYDDAQAKQQQRSIAAVAPIDSAANSATSSLAKLLYLIAKNPVTEPWTALHQADWVAGRFCGCYGVSDENNSLKLGYDAVNQRWPDWIRELDLPAGCLPQVVAPGERIGQLQSQAASILGLRVNIPIIAGTTDSTAAALASGVNQPGDAVTCLGSTLVLKILSQSPIFRAKYGIYSHRLGDLWLVGGASNSGGAVLRQYFSVAQMDAMGADLTPDQATGLDYYPLLRPGERFPVNDPGYPPRLEPRPQDGRLFFQGLLEGIAKIEQQGYERLAELGAPTPKSITTIGGGAHNHGWQMIRQRILGIPVCRADYQEAAYGAALLARKGALSLGT